MTDKAYEESSDGLVSRLKRQTNMLSERCERMLRREVSIMVTVMSVVGQLNNCIFKAQNINYFYYISHKLTLFIKSIFFWLVSSHRRELV